MDSIVDHLPCSPGPVKLRRLGVDALKHLEMLTALDQRKGLLGLEGVETSVLLVSQSIGQ